jgi:hypothetical protein
VKVAAQDNNDVTACVGVGLNVGSRFETKEEQGLSAVLKRLLLTGRIFFFFFFFFSCFILLLPGPVTEQLESMGASLVRSEVKCKDSIYVAGEVLRPYAKVICDHLCDDLM